MYFCSLPLLMMQFVFPYRYEKDGEALLVLIPSEEEGMVEQLKTKKIPVSKIKYVGYLILNTMEMNLDIMFS